MAEPRFIVTTKALDKNSTTILYSGPNRNRAIEVANFWDERVDVAFVDTYTETALDRAMRRFDEAIEKLSV